MSRTSILNKKLFQIKPRIRYFSLEPKVQKVTYKCYNDIEVKNESQKMILKPIQQYLETIDHPQTKLKLQYILVVFKQNFNGIHYKSIAYLERLLLHLIGHSQTKKLQYYLIKVIQNCEKISNMSFKSFKQSKMQLKQMQLKHQKERSLKIKRFSTQQKKTTKINKSRSQIGQQQHTSNEPNEQLFSNQYSMFPFSILKKDRRKSSYSKIFDFKGQHIFLKFLSTKIIQNNKKLHIPFRQINGTDLYRDDHTYTPEQKRQIDLSYLRTQSLWIKGRCQEIQNKRDQFSFKNLQRQYKVNYGNLKQRALNDYLNYTKLGQIPEKKIQKLKLVDINNCHL